MINNTKMKVANKWADKLEEIHSDMDGVWAYTKEGFMFESSDSHTERHDTQKDLYKAIQTIVPCDCKECNKQAAAADEIIENCIEGNAAQHDEDDIDFAVAYTTKDNDSMIAAVNGWKAAQETKAIQTPTEIEEQIHNANFACKVNTLDEVFEERSAWGERFLIVEMVEMSEAEIEEFSNNMLTDWDFLKGKGGTNTTTFPKSAEGKENMFEFTESEMKEFQRGSYRECVGITTPEGGGMIIVDPQGHSYARYTAVI